MKYERKLDMKFVCSVCGYVYEGNEAPEKCPQCGAPASKFNKATEGEKTYVTEHVVGVAKDVDAEILQGLRDNFNGVCISLSSLFILRSISVFPGCF